MGLSGITRAQTGQPLTVNPQRSDRLEAAPLFTRRANLGLAPHVRRRFAFDPSVYTAAPVNAAETPCWRYHRAGYYSWDLSLRKSFNLPREGMRLAFQMDAFNAFNRTNLNNPATTVTGGGFGQISGAAPPRNLQFGVKFNF